MDGISHEITLRKVRNKIETDILNLKKELFSIVGIFVGIKYIYYCLVYNYQLFGLYVGWSPSPPNLKKPTT